MSSIVILGVGIVAGIITGLIGASGVIVIVPGLTLLGYSAFDAIGTSLFADAVASLVVSWTYYQVGNLDLRQGWWIAIGSVLGAQIGSMISPNIPEIGLSNSFGIFLIVTAVIFWRRGRTNGISATGEPTADTYTENNAPQGLRRSIVALGLGLLVGIMSGLLGAGGGVLILLILVFVLDKVSTLCFNRNVKPALLSRRNLLRSDVWFGESFNAGCC